MGTRKNFPVAAMISDSIIALPVGPHLNIKDMKIIGSELKSCIENYYE